MRILPEKLRNFLLIAATLPFYTSAEPRFGDVRVVGPGVISSPAHEFGATQSPHSTYLFYTISNMRYTHMTIMQSERKGNVWQSPVVASFSGYHNDADPGLSPDGSRIYFLSQRPVNGETPYGLQIWYSEKTRGQEWGNAHLIDQELGIDGAKTYPSVARNMTLYFSNNGELYRSEYKNGLHQKAEKLGIKTTSAAVAPDESFIIYHHSEPGVKNTDLYISFNRDNQWSAGKKLPSHINSQFSESSPSITPDGQGVYFTSDRLDYTKVKWPRSQKITTYQQVKNELAKQWENGSRNIYYVPIITE